MAKIKIVYDKQDDVPEAHRELYEEKEGKWHLTGVEGLKTPADVAALQKVVDTERKRTKEAEAKLAKFVDVDLDKYQAAVDEVDELKARIEALGKGGQLDEAKLDTIVQGRVKRALAPVERDRDALKAKLATAEGKVLELGGTITRGKLETVLRKAAADIKVVSSAMEDVVLVGSTIFELDEQTGNPMTRELPGVTPGLSPAEWLRDQQSVRSHWWPLSQGGGARGINGASFSTGVNPWSAEGWNVTEQGRFMTQHGAERAGQAAKMAGTTIGGDKPAPRAR